MKYVKNKDVRQVNKSSFLFILQKKEYMKNTKKIEKKNEKEGNQNDT